MQIQSKCAYLFGSFEMNLVVCVNNEEELEQYWEALCCLCTGACLYVVGFENKTSNNSASGFHHGIAMLNGFVKRVIESTMIKRVKQHKLEIELNYGEET